MLRFSCQLQLGEWELTTGTPEHSISCTRLGALLQISRLLPEKQELRKLTAWGSLRTPPGYKGATGRPSSLHDGTEGSGASPLLPAVSSANTLRR